MIYTNKFFQLFIIIILFIHLVIGTPFTISEADEVVESSETIENITPTENTVLSEPITETFPVTEVMVTDESTIITYTEDSTIPSESETIIVEEGVPSTTITYTEESLGSETNTNIITGSNNETGYLDGVETTLSENEVVTGNIIPDIEILPENIFSGVSENNILLSEQPELVQYQPQKEFIITNGLIDPLSIDSHNVVDENSDMTFCSYVSYLNLKHITSGPEESFTRGDAINIWTSLTFQSTVAATGEVIFTGTNLSGQQFIEYLSGVYTTSGDTLFDIVTLKPKKPDDFTIGLSLHQSHRFVIFLGTDYQRYVLDPIRTDSSDPILLTSYLTAHIFEYEDIKIITSYTLTDTISEEKEKILTTGDTENVIVVHSPMEFLPYVLQGLISAPNTGDTITNEVVFHTGFRYETLDGSISAKIPAGLIIKTADEENFNPFTFNIQESSGNNNELSSGYDDSFKFGIDGQHLIFSQPIGLTLQTPEYEENALLDLMVQHEGQEWNKQGLTNNSIAQCLPDGSVGEEDQGHTSQVLSGKVLFYTCGASSFALGYVPGLASPNGAVTTIREQPNGKILIGGAFTTVGGVARNRIARLNADKSLDTTFNPNLNNTISDIKIQDDGKILIGGTFTGVGATVRNRIARLYPDGSVDTTFNPNSNNIVNDIEIQDDGKILLGGTFTTIGGTTRNYAARVSSTGFLDTSFNATISTTAIVNDIELQPDGKILLGGTFVTVGGVTRNRIARVSSTGLLDTTFNPNSNNIVNDIQLQPDGNIVVGGSFTTVGGVTRNRIARVTSTGALDTSFNPNAGNLINTIAIQPDGKILLGGTFTTMGGVSRSRVARITSTGALDTSFNPNASTTVSKIMVLDSGKIAVGGSFTSFGGVSQAYLAYYDNNIIDTTYNVRPNGVVNKVLVQPDGKILIGGAFTTIGGVARNRIARLNSDNSLDVNFNPSTSGTITDIKLQSNGDILLGGTFTGVGGISRNNIARITSTGALDTSFNPNANNTISSIAVQSNGDILLGGTFTTIGGITRNRIARVSSTGALDTSFNPNANNSINDIEIQDDENILLGGTFTTIGGITRNRIARVSSTGALDTSFNPNASSTVTDIELQPDGNILLGGAFTTLSGTTRNYIGRITSTGTVDTSFNPNANVNIVALHILDNGDIVLGGTFTTIGGVARLQLAKISSAGVLDTNFNIPFSASTSVNTIDRDYEGNLVVGGSFSTMNGNANNIYFGRIGLNNIANNLSLWMRADTGTNCTTDGCTISQWDDNSNYSNHAIQPSAGAQPIYKTNILNGNPVINFNTTAKYLTSTMTGSYKTVFAVRNLAMTGYQYLFSAPSLGDFSIRTAAGFNGTGVLSYTDGPNIGDWSNNGQLAIDGKVTNTGKTRYHVVRDVASSVTTNSYSISNTLSNRGMYGDDGVAELIVYNTGIDTKTTNKIESYLSIKYGITLDQSVVGGQNYIMSNDRIYWSTGVAGIYDEDIAGIARDDSMNLLQNRSQSINNTGDIIIENTEPLNNHKSLLRANNAGSTGTWTTGEVSSGISKKINRERHIQEKNGDIGDIIITYPIATGLLATGELGLMIDTDGDFTNGGTSIVTGSLSGGYRTFTTNLSDNNYISFGIINNGDVCIEGPDTFNIGTYTIQNTGQIVSIQSDYFKVDDQKGGNDGYYTTLSISNLTGSSGGNVISSVASIQIRATTIDTLSGTANASVILDTSITSYISANTPVTFIKRDTGAGVGTQGTYGSQIDFRVSIPAYQRADIYSGTITYTLYEN